MVDIDTSQLATPFSEENPCGENLRYEGTYDRIQKARREDDPKLAQGVWQTSLKRADWKEVEAICRVALETRTKDLQIAVWLLEAWLSLHRFAGVARGMRMVNQLCEDFWEDLYPTIDDGDIEFRLAPINFVNEKLSIKLRQISITNPDDPERRYSLFDWQNATKLDNIARKNERAMRDAQRENLLTLAEFNTAAERTPTPFLEQSLADVDAAIAQTRALAHTLDEKCGKDSPSLIRFREVLEENRQLIVQLLHSRGVEVTSPRVQTIEEPTMAAMAAETEELAGALSGAAPETESAETAAPFLGAKAPRGPIGSRAEAYRVLAEASDFLMRTEPHSPTPYLVRRAIVWGEMPLPSLLQELLQDGSDLAGIYRLLGMDFMNTDYSE